MVLNARNLRTIVPELKGFMYGLGFRLVIFDHQELQGLGFSVIFGWQGTKKQILVVLSKQPPITYSKGPRTQIIGF